MAKTQTVLQFIGMIEHLPQYISEKAGILEAEGIESGKAEIELILCHVLEVDRLHLYLHGSRLLNETACQRVDEIIQRRVTRYPLQYILGEAWFAGRRFFVSPAVMVPTPETELLCEHAVGFVRSRQLATQRILDLGVGSGVISVTIACELPGASVLALDVSAEAIAVARRNAQEHGAEDTIEFRQSDSFSAVQPDESFDLILSNPPYIREADYAGLPPEVKADPRVALVAGEEGLDAIRTIVRQAPEYLAKDGRIMFEIGYEQGRQVADLTERDKRYRSINIIRDLNDLDRLVILSCQGEAGAA